MRVSQRASVCVVAKKATGISTDCVACVQQDDGVFVSFQPTCILIQRRANVHPQLRRWKIKGKHFSAFDQTIFFSLRPLTITLPYFRMQLFFCRRCKQDPHTRMHLAGQRNTLGLLHEFFFFYSFFAITCESQYSVFTLEEKCVDGLQGTTQNQKEEVQSADCICPYMLAVWLISPVIECLQQKGSCLFGSILILDNLYFDAFMNTNYIRRRARNTITP